MSAALLLAAAACSSISDSVSSPFESSAASSASSSPSSESYRNEVRDYTVSYVKSGGQFDAFTRGLSGVAQRNGVTNWESDQNTYVGIGAGLKKAGVPPDQFEVWKTNLSKGDATRAASMQKGYAQ
jgi:hypothetical protein